MSTDDLEYFRQRAAEETELATHAAAEEIAQIHLTLAAKYWSLAEREATRDKPSTES